MIEKPLSKHKKILLALPGKKRFTRLKDALKDVSQTLNQQHEQIHSRLVKSGKGAL